MQILTNAPERTDEWTGFLIEPGRVKSSFESGFGGANAWWWARLADGGSGALREGPAPAPLAFWPRVVAIAEAPRSQYDVLVECAREPGLPAEPVAVLALAGVGFHGNRGRPWQAAAGNLHLSVAVPVDLAAATCGPVLPALAAVAVTDALAESCGRDLGARIKWVNDILVGEAKLGGVVASAQLLGPRITRLVLGIGLNVRVAPPVAPTLFVPAVTCLAAHPAGAAAAAAPGHLLAGLLTALARRVVELQADGPETLAAAYRARCRDVGRTVAVWAEGLSDTADPAALPPPVARGRVVGFGPDLGLCLEGGSAPLAGGRLAYLDDADGAAGAADAGDAVPGD
jgi:BirA family biotin operon repressor/biotin-[acetyl-CoA-carboxylase] ligase